MVVAAVLERFWNKYPKGRDGGLKLVATNLPECCQCTCFVCCVSVGLYKL